MGKSRKEESGPAPAKLEGEELHQRQEELQKKILATRLELSDLFNEAIALGAVTEIEVLLHSHYILFDATLKLIAVTLKKAMESGELATIQGKQELAKTINSMCRKCSMFIKHPETKEECFLLAINDKWGGKFVLENRKTKKRSCTTSDIKTLLPLSFTGPIQTMY